MSAAKNQTKKANKILSYLIFMLGFILYKENRKDIWPTNQEGYITQESFLVSMDQLKSL